MLLICKLHDVDREINYLHYISNEWLSQQAVNHQLLSSSSSAAVIDAEPSKRRMDSRPLDGHHDNDDGYNNNLYSLILNTTKTAKNTTIITTKTKDNYSNEIFDEEKSLDQEKDLFNDLSSFTNYRLRPISSPIIAKRKSQPLENNQKLASRHHQPTNKPKSSTSIVDDGSSTNLHHNQQLKTQPITNHKQNRLSPVKNIIIHHDDHKNNVDEPQEFAASNHDVIELANIISIITYLKEDVDVLMSMIKKIYNF